MKDFENLLAAMALPDPFYGKVLGESRKRPLTAVLGSQDEGRLAGIPLAQDAASALGIEGNWKRQNGKNIQKGEEIARFRGLAEQILKV